jgi:hypothetical protein
MGHPGFLVPVEQQVPPQRPDLHSDRGWQNSGAKAQMDGIFCGTAEAVP